MSQLSQGAGAAKHLEVVHFHDGVRRHEVLHVGGPLVHGDHARKQRVVQLFCDVVCSMRLLGDVTFFCGSMLPPDLLVENSSAEQMLQRVYAGRK